MLLFYGAARYRGGGAEGGAAGVWSSVSLAPRIAAVIECADSTENALRPGKAASTPTALANQGLAGRCGLEGGYLAPEWAASNREVSLPGGSDISDDRRGAWQRRGRTRSLTKAAGGVVLHSARSQMSLASASRVRVKGIGSRWVESI